MGFFYAMQDYFQIEKQFLAQFPAEEQTEFKAQFWRLLADKYGLKRIDVIGGLKTLSKSEIVLFKADLSSLTEGEVLQYIIGWEYFAGNKFIVDSSVLVPRPETEELVYLLKDRCADAKRIIDLATGSGCIALSLSNGSNTVYALEKSLEALKIARMNAGQLKRSVIFIEDDILKPGQKWPEKLDLIVSNPPYVLWSEKGEMSARVFGQEPEMALFVPDKDPLLFYKPIALYAEKALNDKGVLALEINPMFGKDLMRLLKDSFRSVDLLEDQFGKSRFIWAIK